MFHYQKESMIYFSLYTLDFYKYYHFKIKEKINILEDLFFMSEKLFFYVAMNIL